MLLIHLYRSPQTLWKILTFTAVICLVYQQGPKWIHSIYYLQTTQAEIEYRRVAHRIISKAQPQKSWELSVLNAWFQVRGIDTPALNSTVTLQQQWKTIIYYWNAYQHPKFASTIH